MSDPSPEKFSPPKDDPKKSQAESASQSAPAFDVWESLLLQKTGLTKDSIRALRKNKLTRGVHWDLNGQRVVYCAEGVQELQRIARLTGQPPAENAAQSNAQQQPDGNKPPEVVVLKAFRPAARNTRILEAYLPDSTGPNDPKNRVRVRVRSNKNFILGMEIPCRLIPGFTDYYELTRREPRARGRW